MSRKRSTLVLPEVDNTFFPDSNTHRAIEIYERQGTDLAKIGTAVTTHNAGTAARAAKNNFAQEKLHEMTICSSQNFKKTAVFLGEQVKEVRGIHFEEETNAFNRHLLQLAANHNEGTLRISAKGIGEIVAQPVLPEPDKEEKKGFWARVFGG